MSEYTSLEEYSYKDIMEEKDGYEMEWVCATTFSIDMASIVPIIYFANSYYEDSTLEEAIIKAKNKVRIFYQYNKFQYTSIKANFRTILESFFKNACVPVKTEGYCFHPKIILMKYRKNQENDEKYIYRLSVASRNLTGSYADECVAILECSNADNIELPGTLDELINILDEFEFALSNGKSVKVISQRDNKTKIIDQMKKNTIHNVICVSPGYEKNSLIYNEYKYKCKTYYKSDNNSHAKVYHITRKDNTKEIWLGSANCSKSGLGDKDKNNNYECVVCIPVELTSEEYENILKNNGYQYDNNPPSYKESDTDENNKLVESFLAAIGMVKIKFNKINSDTYKVQLFFDKEIKLSEYGKLQIHLCGKKIDLESMEVNEKIKDINVGNCIKKDLSMMILFEAKIEDKVIRRVLCADYYDDYTEKILDEQYKEASERIPLRKEIIPSVVEDAGISRQSYSGGTGAYLVGNIFKEQEYERLLQWYANGYDMQKLKCRILANENRYYDQNKYKEVLKMVEKLI